MNTDRFNEGPPALDRQHPEEREREDDDKLPKMRPANHGDEIEAALRWRDEQTERVQTAKMVEKATTGQPDAGTGHSDSPVPSQNRTDSDLAGARVAKMVELAMKHHRLECLSRDLIDLLRTIERMHPEGSYPHERLDVRIRNAERVIQDNQIL
jgi:hypothetical protein